MLFACDIFIALSCDVFTARPEPALSMEIGPNLMHCIVFVFSTVEEETYEAAEEEAQENEAEIEIAEAS
jgi:hypothetical protein